jgi:hypothetical protein
MIMNNHIRKSQQILSGWLAFSVIALTPMPLAFAEQYERVYNVQTQRYVYVPVEDRSLSSRLKNVFRKPLVKKTVVGAGIGTGVGIITKHPLRGAAGGAAAGVGVGLLDKSKTLKHEPFARRTLKGAVIGTGAAIGLGTGLLPAAAVGAGGGAIYHYGKRWLNGRDRD